jgi:hypothetical protein
MKPLTPYPVIGSVYVVESGPRNQTNGTHVVGLGAEIDINTMLLDEYCFSSPSDLTYDLMSLIGAVRYADRSIKRHHSDGWGRKISLDIPMLNKRLWADEEVTALLQDCLGYLTGDEWQISFKPRKSKPHPPAQAHAISVPAGPRVFIPYSHGLDSYAQMRLLQDREPDTEVICVFTDSKPNSKTWKEFCLARPKGGVRAIRVPVIVHEPHHAEPSFRSRPFIYYMLSAYGAFVTGSNRVLIPENGQGSLGGSLVPLGSEAKHRSCHPGFTTRLSNLLEKLTGQPVNFEHPALFHTKGQVMAELAAIEPNTETWLVEHWSCSHDQRHANHEGHRVHCGACGNCILRRVSARTAGINDVTKYKFSQLNSNSLEQAVLGSGDAPRGIKAFSDLAGNSARSMQRLAELSQEPESPVVWSEAAGLAEYMGQEAKITHTQLMGLLQQHEKEWNGFLTECGNHSWIVQMARG